jgi:hypothetical protein
MRSQAALLDVKRAALSPERDWNHAAVGRPADREAPLAEHQELQGNGHDFSQVPVQAARAPGRAREQQREVPPIVDEVLRRPGQRLDPSTRAFMEARFGHDFSGVRVHTDPLAAASAQAVEALAYTVGHNIAFGPGQYQPWTPAGQRLMAHELSHVVQNRHQAGRAGGRLDRAPAPKTAGPSPKSQPTAKPKTDPSRPPDKAAWSAKDLLAYPLFVDVFKDLVRKKLTTQERAALRLKGTEAAAFYAWFHGIGQALLGIGGEKAEDDAGKVLETTQKYLEAMQGVTPTKDVLIDGFSRIIGLRLDDYLASDLFMLRLKRHALSIPTLILLAQGVYSTVQGVKEPSEGAGELTATEWSKHTGLAVWAVGKLAKKYVTAPDLFDYGPLKLATHPVFAATPFAGGAVPSGLTAEQSKEVEGEGGQLKLGLTLNLVPFFNSDLSTDDVTDLHKSGWQTSVWFTYDQLKPGAIMAQAGQLPETKVKGGTLFGGKGHLGLLEAGATYEPGGETGKTLTSWFLKGGYGYSGKSGEVLKKLGFTATYLDWTPTFVLAPPGEKGTPSEGRAAQITPFAGVELGTSRHKFSAAAALSFVTGSSEALGIGSFRGDLSYTYLGDASPGELPAFKIDLSGSLNRLDWWNPQSPLMWGIQSKVSAGPWFGGVQVMGGAGGVPESRMKLLQTPIKVKVPTAVIFNLGHQF